MTYYQPLLPIFGDWDDLLALVGKGEAEILHWACRLEMEFVEWFIRK